MANKILASDERLQFLRSLPPLNALRSSVAAARAGTFAAAGTELCVSPVAVGRMVKRLEDFLAFSLFTRNGRHIQVTERGQEYFSEIIPHIAAIAQITDRVRRRNATDTLRLCVNSAMAIQWLMPRLPRFYEKHSNVDLEIITTTALADFDHSHYDAALIVGRGGATFSREVKLVNEAIIPQEMVPICSPELLRGQPITCLGDILHHRLIHLLQGSELWLRWAKKALVSEDDAEVRAAVDDGFFARGMTFDGLTPALQATRAGSGVIICPYAMVADEISTGTLVRPLPTVLQTSLNYQFVYLETLRRSPNLIAFRNWIRDESKKYVSPMT